MSYFIHRGKLVRQEKPLHLSVTEKGREWFATITDPPKEWRRWFEFVRAKTTEMFGDPDVTIENEDKAAEALALQGICPPAPRRATLYW